MTGNQIFRYLFEGGKYTLPYLISFSCHGSEINLVNSRQDCIFEGTTYKASTFVYSEPDIYGKGGSLKVELITNDLIEFFEKSDNSLKINVKGVINRNGEIEQIKIYNHMFVSVSWDSGMVANISLNPDDRLQMTFPPYVFDSDNNRGGN